jgi:hypothetical protein
MLYVVALVATLILAVDQLVTAQNMMPKAAIREYGSIAVQPPIEPTLQTTPGPPSFATRACGTPEILTPTTRNSTAWQKSGFQTF